MRVLRAIVKRLNGFSVGLRNALRLNSQIIGLCLPFDKLREPLLVLNLRKVSLFGDGFSDLPQVNPNIGYLRSLWSFIAFFFGD